MVHCARSPFEGTVGSFPPLSFLFSFPNFSWFAVTHTQLQGTSLGVLPDPTRGFLPGRGLEALIPRVGSHGIRVIPGLRVIAVGVSGADPMELHRILLQQNPQDVFYVSTFDDFPQILQELIEAICSDPQLPRTQIPPGKVSSYTWE